MSVRFKEFNTWQKQPRKENETPLEEAAAFASELKPERLINISHTRYPPGLFTRSSRCLPTDVVTVWYWDGD